MAAAEKIDRGYLGRVLQLTLLAPDIVEAILDGPQPAGVGLPRLMEPVPVGWSEQWQALLNTAPAPELSPHPSAATTSPTRAIHG
jgi:hypothetical protein